MSGLKTEIYSPTGVEARSPKPNVSRPSFPVKALGENPSLLFPASSGPWPFSAYGSNAPISASVFTQPSSLCHLLFFSDKGTHHWIRGPLYSRMISSQDSHLNYICRDPYSKYGHILRYQGLAWAELFNHVQV